MARRNRYTFRTEKERQRLRTKKFLIVFFSFLLVFGCLSVLYLLINYDFDLSNIKKRGDDPSSDAEEQADHELQDVSGSKYILFFCTNDTKTDIRFVSVLKTDFDEKMFTICTESKTESINTGGVFTSFLGHYRRGGAKELVAAVEKFNGIKISKYVSSDDIGFAKAINRMGQLKLDLERSINYHSSDFSLVLMKGEQKLRGDDVLKYMHFCSLIGDEGLERQSRLIETMLRQYLTKENVDNGDRLFSSIINAVDSDITVMDFKNMRGMLETICANDFSYDVTTYFKDTVG
ncbi:MAG: LCP family protein [Clostridiales bacterium]|nr:LCP family protein [Clostridiales bacterium]